MSFSRTFLLSLPDAKTQAPFGVSLSSHLQSAYFAASDGRGYREQAEIDSCVTRCGRCATSDPSELTSPLRMRSLYVGAGVAVTVALALAVLILIVLPGSATVVVPNLVGKSLASADDTLSSLTLKVTVIHLGLGTPDARQGTVLAQVPSSGTAVRKGATVQVNVYGALTNGPTVRIPNLIGMLEWRASNVIVNRGLTPVVRGPAHSGAGYQYWKIVAQTPRPGTALDVGAGTVAIWMQAPSPVTVTSRISTSACTSLEATNHVHVVAA
jgi:hypothetical protein